MKSQENITPTPLQIDMEKHSLPTVENMNIVIVGHVDHGKSTIIGRLLADTHSLPEGKLEQVQETCRRNSKPFEYAFLLDSLKDEQTQGITIDSARCFFKTARRNYIIIDAPGHIEFLKNMISGASRAEAALLVIDVTEGIQENSKRHGYMLSMLGIKQITILVNKMDLVDYAQTKFDQIVFEYTEFLKQIKITPQSFVPVSGIKGDNIASHSENMSWFYGHHVLEVLDNFQCPKIPEDKPFRMPVQGIYKFTQDNDNRRIVAGTIDSGQIKTGDEIVFYPSGKKSEIATIENFNKMEQFNVKAGNATGFTLKSQIYITRGEIVAKTNEPKPQVTSRIKANIFWLGPEPAKTQKSYFLKIGTAKVEMKIEQVIRVIDASNLKVNQKEFIERHDVAECIVKLEKTIAFDLPSVNILTSRFVIVDNYEIAGGGIIQEGLSDEQSWIRDAIFTRNYKWETSMISNEERSEKYNQRATLIVITGQKDIRKKPIAKALERILFNSGKIVYALGRGNDLYGVDADIKCKSPENKEHIQRLAEVAHIMLEAGIILIITVTELTQQDLETLKASVNSKNILTVWIGKNISTDTDIVNDIHFVEFQSEEAAAIKIRILLQERGIIFKP